MGVERLVALISESGQAPALEVPDVYLVHQGSEAARLAPRVAEGLRDVGLNLAYHCGGGGFKSQMKKADASGAMFAVIIGDDEAVAGQVTLKPLRGNGDQQNEQQRVSLDELADVIMNSYIDGEEA